MVPCALAVLAIPCFVVSVIVEAPISQHLLRSAERRSLWRATAIANACSYVLLALLIEATELCSRAADRENTVICVTCVGVRPGRAAWCPCCELPLDLGL